MTVLHLSILLPFVLLTGGLAGYLLRGWRARADAETHRAREIAREIEWVEEKARLETELEALRHSRTEITAFIQDRDREAALRFENLCNRIFDEKTARLKEQNSEALGLLLTPLREKLATFQQKIEESAREQFSLKNEIRTIVSLNENMRLQTESLTKALRGEVKQQGKWGEVMLERLLERSGLRRGQEYQTQGEGMGLRDGETGRRQMPDVTVLLPEGKHIIIDAKVSLIAYEAYTAAEDDDARAAAMKDFSASIRAHVKGLAGRGYHNSAQLGSPDFVLMFVPIEGAYALAMQEDGGLHDEAWKQQIVIVGPSTLFATLRTIASVWRMERQNKNAQDIAERGGRLYDKFVAFLADVEDIGQRIAQTRAAYDKAVGKLSSGPGNLVRQAEMLQKLGVKSQKAIPPRFAQEEEPEEKGGDDTDHPHHDNSDERNT